MSHAVPAPRAPRTWYFFGTLCFSLLAYLALNIGGLLTLVGVFIAQGFPSTADYEHLFKQGYVHAAVLLGGFPCELAVIWLAVRLARRQFSEYLALSWPTPQQLVFALLVMFGVLPVLGWGGLAIGKTMDAGVIAEYISARGDGRLILFLFLVTGCIGAPLVEEFVVRGFLLRGWSESFVRPAGAIVLSSALWALCHFQYDWFGISEIFVIGLVLGYFRYRSGSTWLTVVMHSANNLYAYLLVSLAA